MKLTLRIITLLCYLLPCCFFLMTCNDFTIHVAYNQHEADSIIKLPANKVVQTAKDSKGTSVDTISQKIVVYDTTGKYEMEEARLLYINNKDFMVRLLFPAWKSLSGVGALFYFKNLVGQIAIGIAMLVSLILLLAYKWLKKPKARMILLLTGIFCLLIFIIASMLSHVSLLFGIWAILAMHLFQCWLEWREKGLV